jgi:hypothetical protein
MFDGYWRRKYRHNSRALAAEGGCLLLFLHGLAELAHVLDDLRNLILAQLVLKGGHVAIPIVHRFVKLGVWLLLNFLRAKIGSLQLFT